MKKIFAALFVILPLGFAVIFSINSVFSESFPFFREPVSNSQFLDQTYQAAKEYCQNNTNSEINQNQSYNECIKMIDEWFTDNPYK